MVAAIEFDVHSNTWIDHRQPAPEAAVPSARQLWRQAVAEAAERARAALPEANGRIDCAVALVLQGDVELLADGSARVGSQSDAGTVYHVVRECQCKDAERAPHGGQCKHLIARGIAVRAQARLEEMMDDLNAQASAQDAEETFWAFQTPQPAATQPVAPSLPEAPASANAFVVIDGHRVQITVRGHTLGGVLTEIRTVLQQFPAEAAAEARTPPAAPPAPAATPEPQGVKPCPVHPGEMLRLNTKNGQQWHSHRLADGSGWCRGK